MTTFLRSGLYLADGLFQNSDRLLVIVPVGNMNEAETDGKLTAPDEVENDIHRVIADILAGSLGPPCMPSEGQFEIGSESGGSTRANWSCRYVLMGSPFVCRLSLNPQALPARALSQAEDNIRPEVFDDTEELVPVKFNRKDDLF